jgi:hypothetical protein
MSKRAPSRSIRFLDREFPDGSYVADGERLVEWTDEVSAQEAMLFSQGAERAKEMLDNAGPARGREAGAAPSGVGRRRLRA